MDKERQILNPNIEILNKFQCSKIQKESTIQLYLCYCLAAHALRALYQESNLL